MPKQKNMISGTQVINIPKESLVLMCAAPNSGKTAFTKKHFSKRKDVTLICSDDLFRENAQKASLFETYESVMKKTIITLESTVKNAVSNGHIVVIDATSHYLEQRLDMIKEFRPLFKNIILIVIDLDLPDLKRHGVKESIPILERFGMVSPNEEDTEVISKFIKLQFLNGDIYKGVDTVFRVNSKSLNNCKVFIM